MGGGRFVRGWVLSCLWEVELVCYCLWYNSSILFSPLYNRPALAKFERETTHPLDAVLL